MVIGARENGGNAEKTAENRSREGQMTEQRARQMTGGGPNQGRKETAIGKWAGRFGLKNSPSGQASPTGRRLGVRDIEQP